MESWTERITLPEGGLNFFARASEQKAAYRQAKKTHNLSTTFVDMLRELRQDSQELALFDWLLWRYHYLPYSSGNSEKS